MSKEMIVSVNGREKKIAILENDQVTEFYIERGEDNSGIVGNIYKGRVMRVLPGMQSAFVDIGLERDAFLYVSDFFDEEEEFERIVMDKAKHGDVNAERAAAEQIQQARLEREQLIEATQERVEPLRDSDVLENVEEVVIETQPPVFEQISDNTETPISTTQQTQEESDDNSSKFVKKSVPTFGIGDDTFGRRRNKRKRGKNEEPIRTEDSAPSFGFSAESVERVAEEDEAADEGELFKDARLQERLTDQMHAVEYEVEEKQAPQVGLVFDEKEFSESAFERISDDDSAETKQSVEPTFVQEVITTNAAARIDDVEEVATTQTFERVSDDEEIAPVIEEAETKSKRGSRKSQPKKKQEKKTEVEPTEDLFSFGDKPKKKPAGKKKEGAKSNTPKPSSRKKKDAVKSEEESVVVTEASNEEASAARTTQYEDAEASVTTNVNPSSEFATRRGGRRRRRPAVQGAESSNDGVEEDSGDKNEGVEESSESVTERINERINERSNGRSKRESRPPRSSAPRTSAPPPRRMGGPPTITDLLREGQEILVQIAKEPISKKGARITSHIALPGRYLVYMPTIEHLGVSRKIESASERARLRTLITRIRNEENVPSGGFIVRTAGVGITDDDLRDDARYLVRTWQDLRKGAEKTKAPTMIHRDLDLVQRILRDHLSDDFNAIRVDSEEEYLGIVEFVNRFQPRMVKRVKLYTRDEPILEAYGVQADIDKAIKPRVWLKSGGYLVINQTEALVSIDVNTGKFVGKGGSRLEDTITKTNMEAVQEIVRQIRLRDLGGIIVMDLIDMEERRNRQKVLQTLHEALQGDKSPTKVLSFNDFGLVIMTRKRVKQSLERTLCAPCSYCQGAGLVKSPQTICYEILEEARRLSKHMDDVKQTTLRVNPEVAKTLRSSERDVLFEIEEYLGAVDISSDDRVHQEQFDFAFI